MIFTRFKNWMIKKLGGYTAAEYKAIAILAERREKDIESLQKAVKIQIEAEDFWCGRAATFFCENEKLLGSLNTCEAEIPLGGAMRYNADNVITESRQQTYYLLGKAVYPYAKHFVTTNKYICAVNVQEKENEEWERQPHRIKQGDCDKVPKGTSFELAEDGEYKYSYDGYSFEDECYDDVFNCFEPNEVSE